MPLGGLLPYNNDPRNFISRFSGQQDPFNLQSMLMGGVPEEAPRPLVAPEPAPGGGELDWASIIPQLMAAFGAGQAIRQRDPRALSSVVGQFADSVEQRRRLQLAEEAQRLREEREQRLADQFGQREQRMIDIEQARGAREAASAQRQQTLDLNTLINQISDDSRQVFGPGFEGAPLEEYISQQVGRASALPGADPAGLRALLMSMATGANRPAPEIPLTVVDPENPPATVSSKARVITKPRPREAPLPRAYETTDEEGNRYRIVEDPRTGAEISRRLVGKRPAPAGKQDDALDRIIREAQQGGGGGGQGGPAPGTRRRINGVLAEWDGKGWIAVK